jgi:hypothetical protein
VQEPGRQFCETATQGKEDAASGVGIGAGAVAHREVDAEVVGDAAEAVVADPRQEQLSEVPGVNDRAGRGNAGALEELEVEVDALTDDGTIAEEVGKLGGNGREQRRLFEGGSLDAGKALDLESGKPSRPHERIELAEDAVEAERDRGDLDYFIVVGVETGSLGIDCDVTGRSHAGANLGFERMRESAPTDCSGVARR